MTSNRPYLIRALNEWINDNGLTPYVLVNTRIEGVEVPVQHIQGDKIVLNIASRAVQELDLGNDEITFGARFSGVSMTVRVPINAVLRIYAMETNEGMIFADFDDDGPDDTPPENGGKPALRIVK